MFKVIFVAFYTIAVITAFLYDDESSSNQCTLRCIIPFVRKYHTHTNAIAGTPNYGKHLSYVFGTINEMRTICKDQKYAMDCSKRCRNSTSKTRMLAPLNLMNYFCKTHFQNFTSRNNCVDHLASTKNLCVSNCRLDDNSILQDYCSAGLCVRDCYKSANIQYCGDDKISRIHAEFIVNHGLKTMKKVNKKKLPSQCEKLIKDYNKSQAIAKFAYILLIVIIAFIQL